MAAGMLVERGLDKGGLGFGDSREMMALSRCFLC
jgi:hypothetical protein